MLLGLYVKNAELCFAVFATFAKEDTSFQRTLHLLPGALKKTGTGLGKLGVASNVVGPTLRALQPFARALGPAQEATRQSVETTTPILKNQIRPFARQILPVAVRGGAFPINPVTRRYIEDALRGEQLLNYRRPAAPICALVPWAK